jgi:hypothetical protein
VGSPAGNRRQTRNPKGVSPLPYVIGLVGMIAATIAVMNAASRPPVIEPPRFAVDQKQIQRKALIGATVERRQTDPVAAQRAELEERIVAVRTQSDKVLAAPSVEQLEDVLTQWRTFASQVKDTDFESFVQLRIEEVLATRDKLALKSFEETRTQIYHLISLSNWDAALRRLDTFPRLFLENAEVADSHQKLLSETRDGKQRYEACSLRAFVSFDKQPREEQGIRLVFAQTAGHDGHWMKVTGNHTGRIVFVAELPRIPPKVYLVVQHLSSLHRNRNYSPITLTINGQILVGEWWPHSQTSTRWEVQRYLHPGQNILVWTLGDARTTYWLQRIELTDYEPR